MLKIAEKNKLYNSQPSPQAFSARSILDSTVSCDVTGRYSPSAENSPALSQTSRGQRVKRERLGTRLYNSYYDPNAHKTQCEKR